MPQASLGTSTMTTGSVGMPLMANGIGPAQGMQGMGMSVHTLSCLCSAFVEYVLLLLLLQFHVFGSGLRKNILIFS